MGSSKALHGVLEECRDRMYWLREMGVEDSLVGKRMFGKVEDIGVSLVLAGSPVLERVLVSAENERVEQPD